jgi:hypothetical protein
MIKIWGTHAFADWREITSQNKQGKLAYDYVHIIREMIFWQPFSYRQLPFILFIYFSNFLLRLELRTLWVSCQVIVHFKMSK